MGRSTSEDTRRNLAVRAPIAFAPSALGAVALLGAGLLLFGGCELITGHDRARVALSC